MVIAAEPCTTWAVADLRETVRYVRGHTGLNLPPHLKDLSLENVWEGTDPVGNEQGGL